MSNATSTASGTTVQRLLGSAVAVVVGFLSVAVFSLATDQVLHVIGVYPPWGEPMYDTGLNFLALAYRTLYTILGGYITAALAPRAPMRHVMVVAALGFVAGTAGAIAAIKVGNLGPNWYPIALAITGPPCVWLGGVIHGARHSGR